MNCEFYVTFKLDQSRTQLSPVLASCFRPNDRQDLILKINLDIPDSVLVPEVSIKLGDAVVTRARQELQQIKQELTAMP